MRHTRGAQIVADSKVIFGQFMQIALFQCPLFEKFWPEGYEKVTKPELGREETQTVELKAEHLSGGAKASGTPTRKILVHTGMLPCLVP